MTFYPWLAVLVGIPSFCMHLCVLCLYPSACSNLFKCSTALLQRILIAFPRRLKVTVLVRRENVVYTARIMSFPAVLPVQLLRWGLDSLTYINDKHYNGYDEKLFSLCQARVVI